MPKEMIYGSGPIIYKKTTGHFTIKVGIIFFGTSLSFQQLEGEDYVDVAPNEIDTITRSLVFLLPGLIIMLVGAMLLNTNGSAMWVVFAAFVLLLGLLNEYQGVINFIFSFAGEKAQTFAYLLIFLTFISFIFMVYSLTYPQTAVEFCLRFFT